VLTQGIDKVKSLSSAAAIPQEVRERTFREVSKKPPYGAASARAGQSPHAMRCNGPSCGIFFIELFARRVRLHRAFTRQERQLRVVDVERRSTMKTPFTSRLRCLLLPVHQNPFRDPRLDVYLDQLVEDLIQLLPKIGAIVQPCEDEGLEGNFGAVREVLEHRLIGFHSRVSVRQPRAQARQLGTEEYTVYLYSQY
jgi:hypothetical protein